MYFAYPVFVLRKTENRFFVFLFKIKVVLMGALTGKSSFNYVYFMRNMFFLKSVIGGVLSSCFPFNYGVFGFLRCTPDFHHNCFFK